MACELPAHFAGEYLAQSNNFQWRDISVDPHDIDRLAREMRHNASRALEPAATHYRDSSYMNDQQLADGLAEKGAVIVHFSHHSDMRRPLTFPADLQTAIRHRAQWPLSCSALFPGHTMTPVGSVGVIFAPRVVNVISVSNDDAGASCGQDDIDRSWGRPLDIESFHWSFEVAGPYNEWRVRDAEVTGIFVLDPANIWVKQSIAYPDPTTHREEMTIAMEQISLEEVFAAFPDERVFTLDAHRLIQLQRPTVRA